MHDEDRRDALLKVRVRQDEKATIERAASQAGISVSDFVRQAVSQAARGESYSMK